MIHPRKSARIATTLATALVPVIIATTNCDQLPNTIQETRDRAAIELRNNQVVATARDKDNLSLVAVITPEDESPLILFVQHGEPIESFQKQIGKLLPGEYRIITHDRYGNITIEKYHSDGTTLKKTASNQGKSPWYAPAL